MRKLALLAALVFAATASAETTLRYASLLVETGTIERGKRFVDPPCIKYPAR